MNELGSNKVLFMDAEIWILNNFDVPWNRMLDVYWQMDKEDVVHIYNEILLSHKKEQNWVT